ncbi:AAA family ATPase [Paenibacillus cymbidii]|uniref:AAA family ATPase n=1 Tax=Paenibacillus cymbidii TaxID=1639034 RepID=UPI001080C787
MPASPRVGAGSGAIALEPPQALIGRLVHHAEKVMVGKRESIEASVVVMLCGGNLLIEDVPGVGKTMLARTLAKAAHGEFRRIQFTPDLMPADVTGVSVWNRGTGAFEFRPGPIFANIVLADEINRTSPRTQAALLEAMEEKRVTVDGVTHPLPEPFMLIATQNSVDSVGAYPLPEAQLDRFLIRLSLGYPEERHEIDMLARLSDKHPIDQLRPALYPEELLLLQRQTRLVHVDESLMRYMVRLSAETRTHRELALGASPRATLALMHAAQAKALMNGRGYVIPDDIKAMLAPVLAHRLIVDPLARANGVTGAAVLADIAGKLAAPGYRHTAGR